MTLNIIGSATIKTVDGDLVPCSIEQTGKNYYQLFTKTNPEPLGFINFAIVEEFTGYSPECTQYYGREESEWGKKRLYLIQISSFFNKTYKGIGTALLQAMIEYAFQNGCEGRVMVDAVRTSHIFYRKMGFLSGKSCIKNADCIDNQMASKYWSKTGMPHDQGSYSMYLPYEGRRTWAEKISTQPVLFNLSKAQVGERPTLSTLKPLKIIRDDKVFFKEILENDFNLKAKVSQWVKDFKKENTFFDFDNQDMEHSLLFFGTLVSCSTKDKQALLSHFYSNLHTFEQRVYLLLIYFNHPEKDVEIKESLNAIVKSGKYYHTEFYEAIEKILSLPNVPDKGKEFLQKIIRL